MNKLRDPATQKAIKAFTLLAPSVCKEIKGMAKGIKVLRQQIKKDNDTLKGLGKIGPENNAQADEIINQINNNVDAIKKLRGSLGRTISYCQKITQSVQNTKALSESINDQIKENL